MQRTLCRHRTKTQLQTAKRNSNTNVSFLLTVAQHRYRTVPRHPRLNLNQHLQPSHLSYDGQLMFLHS